MVHKREKCFNCQIAGDEPFAPNDVCNSCYTFLLVYSKDKNTRVPFLTPMRWLADHHQNDNCYACVNKKAMFYSRKIKNTFVYASVPSVQMPVINDTASEMSVDIDEEEGDVDCNMPEMLTPAMDNDTGGEVQAQLSSIGLQSSEMQTESSAGWQPTTSKEESKDYTPKPLSQKELDKLVAKGRLSQKQAEYMARFLKSHKPSCTQTVSKLMKPIHSHIVQM